MDTLQESGCGVGKPARLRLVYVTSKPTARNLTTANGTCHAISCAAFARFVAPHTINEPLDAVTGPPGVQKFVDKTELDIVGHSINSSLLQY